LIVFKEEPDGTAIGVLAWLTFVGGFGEVVSTCIVCLDVAHHLGPVECRGEDWDNRSALTPQEGRCAA
jgi:hypothetical protein